MTLLASPVAIPRRSAATAHQACTWISASCTCKSRSVLQFRLPRFKCIECQPGQDVPAP